MKSALADFGDLVITLGVAAQSAAIGVATADLLPHFSITGSISLQADRYDNLFESASSAGAISPGFSWDIFNYGRLINNVRLQDTVFQELAVNYQQTVLQANAEAENAINTFLTTQEQLQRLGEAVDASSESRLWKLPTSYRLLWRQVLN